MAKRFEGFHDPQSHPFTDFPKHLYHEGLPPIVAHSPGEEKEARDKGYGDDYIHQHYPKAVIIGKDKDGNPIQATAKTPEEEAALLAR